MIAILLNNGNMLIPKRAVDKSGEIIGDGMIEVKKGSQDYKTWLKFSITEDEAAKKKGNP